MKMHGLNPSQITSLVIPTGSRFPNNPTHGEIFHLSCDEPETTTVSQWHPAGIYIFQGAWIKVNDSRRQRRAELIGAQTLEIETPASKVAPPTVGSGFCLASITVAPTNKKAGFTGAASFWVDSSVPTNIVTTVFRGSTLVSLTVDFVEALRPRSICTSFYDLPQTSAFSTYMLRVDADAVGLVNVNKGGTYFDLDGVAKTAFTVAETA